MSTQLTIYTPEQARAAQSTLSSMPPRLLPSAVPRVLAEQAQISDAMRHGIISECNMVIAANQPAAPMEVSALVRRLMNHYRAPDMSEHDMQGVIEDWLEDLGNFPFDILRDAMAAYRKGSRSHFKPMPGDIIEMANENAGYRMRLAARAKDTFAAIESYTPPPPPTDLDDLPFETPAETVTA